jgi:hypothetical protein
LSVNGRRYGCFDGRVYRRLANRSLHRRLRRYRFNLDGGRYQRRASAGLFGSFSVVISVFFLPARGMDVALYARADQSLPEQLRDIFVD